MYEKRLVFLHKQPLIYRSRQQWIVLYWLKVRWLRLWWSNIFKSFSNKQIYLIFPIKDKIIIRISNKNSKLKFCLLNSKCLRILRKFYKVVNLKRKYLIKSPYLNLYLVESHFNNLSNNIKNNFCMELMRKLKIWFKNIKEDTKELVLVNLQPR